jgi:hypothetical protein
MAKHAHEEFSDRTVTLDDTIYENCKFERCRIVYSGGERMGLVGCRFSQCTFEFGDAAARTIQFLTALYHDMGPDGAAIVEQTFNNIRRPRQNNLMN